MAEPAVFLSYASQDANAARRICEALRTAGVEVWFDQSELRGGDAWDAKIRKQIKECALFVPVISANTQARLEGYFRLEWKLAEDRSHLMARGKPFIVPVAIDETSNYDAHVPDSFLAVQWTRLRSDEPMGDFARQINRLLETPGSRPRTGRGAEAQHTAMSRKGANPRRTWVAIAAVSAVLLLGGAIWRLRPLGTAATVAAPTTLPGRVDSARITEARGLIQQARDLERGRGTLNNERDKLAAADKLLAKASELDPGNGEIWGLWAVVDAQLHYAIPSGSKERQASARLKAKRAMSLAPESFDARFGEAASLVATGGKVALAAAERELRGLQEEQPDHVPVNEWLQRALSLQGRKEEAERLRDELEKVNPAAALGGRLWSVYFKRDYEEAEAIADQILSLTPSDRAAWMVKLWLTLRWHGDLDRALALFEQAPPEFATGDEGVVFGAELFRYRREAGRSLTVLRQHPGDWLESRYFAGPKAILMGKAYRIDQRHDAARNAFHSAIKMLEEKLSADPDNILWLRAKAECLEWAGDDATAAWKLHDQVTGRGMTDRSIEGRMRGLEREAARATAFLTPARLRLDPAHDELRSHPRFPALLAKLEADPRRNPKLNSSAKPALAPPPAPAEKSIAVLAFRQFGAEPDNEYLCEAIPDELCNVLGKLGGLKVAASASAFSFKGPKRERPSEMARQLGVTYLVDGSVQKVGTRVRVRAELLKGSDESVVWKSDTLEPEAKDMFALQDQVVAAIAKNLQLQLGGQPAAPVTINPEAFRLYYEGRRAWTMRGEDEYVAQAEQFFRRAIAADAKLGRAYAGLADTLLNGSLTFAERDSERVREIRALVDSALRLEPESPEAYTARGALGWKTWSFREAEQDLRTAIRLNPSYAHAHHVLGRVLGADGRMDESLSELKTACDLDPLSSRIFDNYGGTLREAGRYTEALSQAERALALQPNNSQALSTKMQALSHLGRHDEALALCRTLAEQNQAGIRGVAILVRAGRLAEAQKLYEGASTAPGRRPTLLALLGRKEEALNTLRAEDAEVITMTGVYYNDSFEQVRDDPRFVRFLTALGVKAAHDRAQAWRAAHPPEKPGKAQSK